MRKNKFLLITLIICSLISTRMQGQTYDNLWKQVEEAQKKSLPKSVVTLVGEIFKRAQAEKNSPQMLKAYTAQTMYRQQLTPDSFYVDLKGLEQWAKISEDQVECAVLHTLIASIYSDYYEDNRWQLRQRTDLGGEAPEDIRQWSSNLFIKKVLDHTYAALEDSTLLLATSSKDYRPFVVLGNGSEYYRHDMYHLLALKGIGSLMKLTWGNADLQEVKSAITAIFDRLIHTYSDLGNKDALILAWLDKMRWIGQYQQENYLQELQKLLAENSDREVAAEIYMEMIQYYMNRDEYVKAYDAANKALELYPRYNRINAIKEARENILMPSVHINMDAMIYPGEAYKMSVSHRNSPGFTIEYYKVNLPVESPLLDRYGDLSKLAKYMTKVSSQRIALVKPADFLMTDTTLTLTAPQEGLYVVRITPEGNQAKKQRAERLASVTRLNILTSQLPGNQLEFVVLDGRSGHPVRDARLRLFSYNKGDKLYLKTLTTNAEGRALTAGNKEHQYVTADKGNDKGMLMQYIRGGYYASPERNSEVERVSQVKLLTDRSLYRPGQTVYVKGIAYNMLADTANVIAGKKYTLQLKDSNRREISSQEVRTNEFGSFTAEIVLPAAGLNGYYYLSTENGSVNIRVEEYKRPTFDIAFVPQEGSYQLGDSIGVKGGIKSYSGVAVQDIPVNYTIHRSMRNWWGRFVINHQLIGSGSVTVDDNGNFAIPVNLSTDESQKNDDGFYIYIVEATATNVAGETQSSTTTLVAGSRSLLLTINMNNQVNKRQPVTATFGVTNLSRQPVNLEGSYKLYPFTNLKEKKIADDPVTTGTFTSNKETTLTGLSNLASGAYKLVIAAKDPSGGQATAELGITLFSPTDNRPPIETDIWYYPENLQFDVNTPAAFVFGTSHQDTYVLMDVFSGNQRIESRAIHLSDSLMRFSYPYQQSYGDGLFVLFCFVKNGTTFTQRIELEKRRPDKTLKLKWEVFRDKLRPGQQEEWRLTIKDPQGVPADAEMLATLYDASLDKIWKNDQTFLIDYRRMLPVTNWIYYNETNYFNLNFGRSNLKYPLLVYDNFWMKTAVDQVHISTRGMLQSRVGGVDLLETVSSEEDSGARVELKYVPVDAMAEAPEVLRNEKPSDMSLAEAGGLMPTEDLRTNFAETAFFYPQLRTSKQGEIVISFTIPESLTRWKFNGYAHTKGMLTGILKGEVVTSKELMLTPNLPRFVRVGDKTSVAASVTNTTEKAVLGTVTLTLFDPMTEKVIAVQKEKFSAAAGKSTGVNFSFTATDKYEMLGCRIIADGGQFSDGEQHLLPVLSNKERIIETVSMPIRGNENREFSLNALFNNNSKTATDRRLTVEFSGNPAWYAIQALPTVSLPTNDNAISWSAAYYANSLAMYILNAQPRIKTMFDSWKAQGGNKETFMSNLQKNQDVKNILLEESPWLMEAASEAEQMHRVATLFDLNNATNNNITALTKLKELQLNNGSWSWYKGMSGSRYITTYILETIVRLNKLTNSSAATAIADMQRLAFNYLHREALDEYNRIRQAEKHGNKSKGVSSAILEYLYLVALSGEKVPSTNNTAHVYFLNKVNENLTSQSVREKAMTAIILHKAGRNAGDFMASLKQHLVKSDELGMYFAFNESPYRWYDLRIPAHVAAMEAFDMVTKDSKTVEEMKIWLLKQKQTQQWDSPVSTVNAVYALLHSGDNLLQNQGDVRITIGGNVMETLAPGQGNTPGTGYVKQTFTDKNMISRPGKAKVEKRDSGIAWGAVYAQYNEEIDKVNPSTGEVSVDKKLYVEKVLGTDKQLIPVTASTPLTVGDKIISRITITLDRAMDFVQLKDQRGACFEPIGALSGYIWNGGLGYYVAVKDASTHFFFDSLGKGVYVLEYSYRVSRAGAYETGLAIIQSAYAPEYASHSESFKVVSK